MKGSVASSVSVVIPCRNEESFIRRCLGSVTNSNFEGSLEIIVADGMSQDGTRQILEELKKSDPRIRILDNPQKDTPSALNIGVQASLGTAVLILGAHCELSPEYIRELDRHLFSQSDIGCVGGRTIPKAEGSAWKAAIADVQKSSFGVGNSLYKIPGENVREVDTVAYGLYRREALDKVGPFNTTLARNQDIEFNSRLRRAGYRIILDPRVAVYYHPRVTLRSFCKQNYGNGYWNIETWRSMPGSLSWRHFVPLAFVVALCVFAIGSVWDPVFRWLLLLVTGPYLLLDLVETAGVVRRRRKLSAVVTFSVFPALHLSYGVGSLIGIFALAGRMTKKRRRAAISPN